jgi:hypothetical protein
VAPIYPVRDGARRLLRRVITGIVYAGVAALLVAIVVANVYAVLHAWRSDRVGWCIVIAALFLTGGGIATAVYLVIHYDEPLPPARTARRRGLSSSNAYR